MKNLAQVAYESVAFLKGKNLPWEDLGGQQQQFYVTMADAISKHLATELMREVQEKSSPNERLKLWEKIQEGYCRACGAICLNNRICHCENDD